MRTVAIASGDRVTARMPEDEEREALQMPPGVPVLFVWRAAGGEPEMHDASVTEITGSG